MALENREGQPVPSVTFRTRQNDEWVDVTSDDLFTGKTVVVFSLPGAFTPTCSSTHLPGYNEYAKLFQQNGVDDIICMSVNDTFVMNAWAKDQEASNVIVIPDGNGEFTEGMGMLVGKEDLGFGKRSWRYSFEVSDAETMLKHINDKAGAPSRAFLMSKPGCPFCAKARDLLTANGIEYEQVELGNGLTTKSLYAISGAGTTPQVFIDGRLIGGSDDLEAYFKK
jgi:glutathione-dependent peroxiredoxin